MHWKLGAKGAALLLVAGGIAWLLKTAMTDTAMTESTPLTEQVLQACKTKPDVRYLGEPEVVRDPPLEIEVLRRGAIRVVWQGDNLRAYTMRTEYDDWAGFSQLDYGGVSGVYEDRTGGLIAIGDQTSYRVTVELVEGRAHFGPRMEFPALSKQPCGLLSRLEGTCWSAEAIFSRELRIGLISGFNRWGGEALFAVGLREGEPETLLEAPQGGLLWLSVSEIFTGFSHLFPFIFIFFGLIRVEAGHFGLRLSSRSLFSRLPLQTMMLPIRLPVPFTLITI
jgi:hypothetical protein